MRLRKDIQGLRALAVSLVVLSHAGFSIFAGGFIGVDVFFVLSGYLISGILFEEQHRTGSIRLANFYSRRIRRLLPALVVMLGTVMWITPRLLSDYEFREQTASLNYAATWTSNFFFSFSSNPYFSELRERDLFLHTWSLSIEEQFYLLWPVLILIIASLASITTGSFKRWLLVTLGALAMASFAVSQYWAESNPLWSFYLMPSRIWEFALGAGTYIWIFESGNHQLRQGILISLKANGGYLGIGGVALIVGSAIAMHAEMSYPSYWAVIPSLGAVLVIVAGELAPAKGASRILSRQAFVWLGDRSYSLYLWHWPILNMGFAWGMQQNISDISVLVTLSLIFAMMSYRWIEQPFRKFRLQQLSPGLVNSFGIIVTVALITTCYAQKRIDPDTITAREIGTHHKFQPSAHAIYTNECDSWFADAEVHPCVIGTPNAPKTLAIIGDSIGTQWVSLLPAIYTAPEWRIVVFIKSSCPIVDEDFFYRRIGKTYKICSHWRNSVIEYLDHVRPDVIFVGSSAFYGFSPTQWTEGTSRILSRLSSISEYVVVIAGTPRLSFNGPGCLERQLSRSSQANELNPDACSEPLIDQQSARVAGFLSTAVSRFSNTHLLNLNDLVCPRAQCMAQDSNGLAVFVDQQHLTAQFVRSKAPEVAERLKNISIQ